jgi:hypothetical protein
VQIDRQTGFGVKLRARNCEAGRVLHFLEEVGRGSKITRRTGLSIFWIPYQEKRREESDELSQ